ncbi:cytochrome P450 [Streptomyces prunicolor]|uniref:cytochrome P450 n=1 Tax=Streptomyces prunicolor TaxID=67348 RepID=UPI0022538E9F|nr:cytochrome P450 [Streptomyces prunicolor]MCX5239063.1 cytochrome P450 [Streptomyces prunicolor]
MTTHPQSGAPQCPAHTPPPPPPIPLPIFGPTFSANPHATYARLRAQGPVVPVEISPHVYGYLAVTHGAVGYLLRNNPALFAKDPVHWAALQRAEIPPGSPALMMMGPRDNALWKDGAEHTRLRSAITSALDRVDTFALAESVARIADQLLDSFAALGHADLMAQYAGPLPMLTVIDFLDSPSSSRSEWIVQSALGKRIVTAVTRLFSAGPDDAAQANADLEEACLELTRLKRAHPGPDVITYLIQGGLSDREMVQTLLLLFGAAAPPESEYIGSALLDIITDPESGGSVHTGVRPVADALDAVMWKNPPVANYHPLYARGPQWVQGMLVQPGYPILCSYAAANSDPDLFVGTSPGAFAGNRAHFGFSAGTHGCPAPGIARVIGEIAVERALDRLPKLALTVAPADVPTLPGPFLAGPAALPVSFQPDTTRLALPGR